MMDWQPDWWKEWEWTWSTGLWGILLAFCLFVLGSGVVLFVLVKLPAEYLIRAESEPAPAHRSGALRWGAFLGKNLLGGIVVLLGVLLSLPGIPGPGLLLIFIGLTLLDFPGKRRLQHQLVARPRVMHTINWLRGRFGKPPLLVANEPGKPREEKTSPRTPTAACRASGSATPVKEVGR